MSYFGKNIKKIRTAKKISQTTFADLFKLKRGSIGAYEEGRAEAKIDTVIEIASYFKLTINQLLCKELTFNEIYHISEINQKFENPGTQTSSEVLIPLVKERDRNEFIEKYNNQTYLQGLQSIKLPDNKSKSVAFEIIGADIGFLNSLINHGDIIVAELFNLEELKNVSLNQYLIIIENERFHISESLVNEKEISLKSFNFNYANEFIKIENIQLIYKPYQIITKRITTDFDLEKKLLNIESKLDKVLKSNGLL
jgi:transcriptional regulator with XRE-family HTH domain